MGLLRPIFFRESRQHQKNSKEIYSPISSTTVFLVFLTILLRIRVPEREVLLAEGEEVGHDSPTNFRGGLRAEKGLLHTVGFQNQRVLAVWRKKESDIYYLHYYECWRGKKPVKSCLVGNKRLYKREGNTYNPICCENLDPKARRFYPPSNISAALRYGRK